MGFLISLLFPAAPQSLDPASVTRPSLPYLNVFLFCFFFVGSHVVMECNISSGINGLIPFWQVNDEDVDSFDITYREQFYE